MSVWGVVLAMAVLVLSGCAETQFVVSAAKRISGSTEPQGPARGGIYKIGNPYEINGVWYYPKVDYQYVETGIASWYGPNFDGDPTANGEIFDMNLVSAAHRTLPLPSVVRVTNLENGRALKIRVNDRGPFARGRIIDISRRGAQLLGFEQQGTAKVRVEIIADESLRLANAILGKQIDENTPPKPEAAPAGRVSSVALAPPDGAKAAPPPTNGHKIETKNGDINAAGNRAAPEVEVDNSVTIVPVAPKSKVFVQAGAFARYENANRLRVLLSNVGPAQIYQVEVSKQPFFRVRLGPANSVAHADQMLAQVVAAGYTDATIVVD